MSEEPVAWTRIPLGEVLTLQRGYDITRKHQRFGVVPVVSSGGISSFHDEAITDGPGVVIGRKGTLGTTFYLTTPYWPHDTTLWVRDFKGSDPRFVYYLLLGQDFRRFDVGSANPTLNRNHIHPMLVDLPSRPEQRGIAATLGALDDKIESNRGTIQHCLDLLDHLAARTAAELPSVPLAHLVTIRKSTFTPAELGDVEMDHFSIPAFDASGLPERISGASIMSNKLTINGSCVLVSRLNPRMNRTWYAVPESGVPAGSSTEFLVLRPALGTTLGGVWLAVRDEYFQASLARRATGTSGSHQRLRPQDALSIEVPDVRLIGAAAHSRADELLELSHQRRIESRQLELLRDALLPELLSGRIRVPEARETVESVI